MDNLITFLETYQFIYVVEEFVTYKHNVNVMFWLSYMPRD